MIAFTTPNGAHSAESVWKRRRAVRVVAALGCGLAVRPLAAQTSGPAMALRGVVVDSAGVPLPYATVRAEALGRDALTDARGQFLVGGVPRGRYDVLVRQVGFAPQHGAVEAVSVESGAAVRDTVRLIRLVVRLAEVEVRPDARCAIGGFTASDSAGVGALFAQLRLNAERLRLVAEAGPAVRRYARARAYVDADGAVVATRADTLAVRTAEPRAYAPGRVAYRVGRREWNLTVPTPDVIADSAFQRVHCFRYAGVDMTDGRTVHRVEFAAADDVGGPDVAGLLSLDTRRRSSDPARARRPAPRQHPPPHPHRRREHYEHRGQEEARDRRVEVVVPDHPPRRRGRRHARGQRAARVDRRA